MDDTIVVTSAPKIASPSVDASIQPSVTVEITDTIKQATDDVGKKLQELIG